MEPYWVIRSGPEDCLLVWLYDSSIRALVCVVFEFCLCEKLVFVLNLDRISYCITGSLELLSVS